MGIVLDQNLRKKFHVREFESLNQNESINPPPKRLSIPSALSASAENKPE